MEGGPVQAFICNNEAAARHLVARGARLTLPAALCLGLWVTWPRRRRGTAEDKQVALGLAALNGRPRRSRGCCRSVLISTRSRRVLLARHAAASCRSGPDRWMPWKSSWKPARSSPRTIRQRTPRHLGGPSAQPRCPAATTEGKQFGRLPVARTELIARGPSRYALRANMRTANREQERSRIRLGQEAEAHDYSTCSDFLRAPSPHRRVHARPCRDTRPAAPSQGTADRCRRLRGSARGRAAAGRTANRGGLRRARRLYVADSSGSNDKTDVQVVERPHCGSPTHR